MDKDRRATCACGAVSVEVRGEPVRVSICHCFACQKRSGAPFAQQARYASENVQTTGKTNRFSRVADSGSPIHFHFCPTCATVMYYFLDQFPEICAVPVGIFEDPNFPAPAFSVYEDRMHHWVSVPEDMEHMR